MNRRLLTPCVLASLATANPCLARYTEELHESNDGAWIFAYVILILIGLKYIADEMKKSPNDGLIAIAIVAAVGLAAYVFPIIGGILAAAVAIMFAYGIFTTGRRK